MNRLLVLGIVMLTAGFAQADLLPPGTKNIAIDYKIETDKEYPDWVFFTVRGSGGVMKVQLDPKTPLVIKGSEAIGAGPAIQKGEKPRKLGYRSSALVAIPKDAEKEYKTEKELHEAIGQFEAKGLVRVKDAFSDHENVKANDPQKSITQHYRITKIDPKDGIALEAIKSDDTKPEEEADPVTFLGQKPFVWIAAGLAVAGVLGFAGFWFTRRGRRTV